MKGFIQGLVWVTIIGQVPKLFGISGEHGNFFEKLFAIIPDLANAHPMSTALGLESLVLLGLIKHFVPKLPAALTAVIASIVLVSLFDLGSQGVDIVGKFEAGLPALAMPQFTMNQLELPDSSCSGYCAMPKHLGRPRRHLQNLAVTSIPIRNWSAMVLLISVQHSAVVLLSAAAPPRPQFLWDQAAKLRWLH